MDASQKRPTAGVRYTLSRAGDDGATTVYRGFAHTKDADLPLSVRVIKPAEASSERAVVTASVEVTETGPDVDIAELEREAAALVKAAARAAKDAARPLPNRISRWRGP